MLGVIIQGAMRKTTVSVKIGVPGEYCKRRNAGEQQPKTPVGALRGTGTGQTPHTLWGTSSKLTLKETNPEKPASGKANPST